MRQGFTVYLPVYLKRRRHARRTDWIPSPLFPRYLFVDMDPERTQWRCIRSTIGAKELIGERHRPLPVPRGIVDAIRGREDAQGNVVLDPGEPFARGEMVEITDGALGNRVGLFEGIADDERVVILLDLLGCEVRVRLPSESVRSYV